MFSILSRSLLSAIAIFMLVACNGSSGSQTTPTANVSNSQLVVRSLASVVAVTAIPGEQKNVHLTLAPGSACALVDGSGKSTGFFLVSDQYGDLDFFVQTSDASPAVDKRTLQCSNGTASSSIALSITRGSGHATLPKPASGDPATMPTEAQIAAANARYHLDLGTATREQLIAAGLPPRPQQDAADAYMRWFHAVASPTTRVYTIAYPVPGLGSIAGALPTTFSNRTQSIHRTPMTEYFQNNNIYSGVAVWESNHSIETASAEWNVPVVTSAFCDSEYSAIFVGMDGLDNTNLEQDGSAQNTTCSNGTIIASYYVWYETLPNDPSYRLFFNITTLSDDVYCQAYLTNSFTSASYWCKDVTSGQVANTSGESVSGTLGRTGEFILERAGINGVPGRLPSFGGPVEPTWVWGTWLADASGNWFNYTSVDYYDYTMQNNSTGDTLATSTANSQPKVGFTWYGSW